MPEYKDPAKTQFRIHAWSVHGPGLPAGVPPPLAALWALLDPPLVAQGGGQSAVSARAALWGPTVRQAPSGQRRETTVAEVADAVQALERDHAQEYARYKRALDHLKDTFPGLGLELGHRRGQARQGQVQTQYVTRQMSNTYDGAAGPTTWWVMLTFDERPTTLVVKPVIRYRAKPGDPNGHNPNENELRRWRQQIEGFWTAKFRITHGATTTVKDVTFDIQFRDWAQAATGREYEVDVVNITHEQAQGEAIFGAAWTAGLRMQDQSWQVRQQASRMSLDGTSLGSPHLKQWGVHDMQAVVHEFGHAIGNPDEYDTVAHNVNFGGHQGLDYNKPGFTTDSIMNDTEKGRPRQRHFAVVAELYRDWILQRNPGDVVVVAVQDPSS